MAKDDVKSELFDDVEENEDVVEAEIVQTLPNGPASHTMLRTITRSDKSTVGKPFWIVDAEVGEWIDKGYELVNAQLVGSDPDAITCVYFLARKPRI